MSDKSNRSNDPELADLKRRLENVVVRGPIEEVSIGNPTRVRVRLRDRLSGWLPWMGFVGANLRVWSPPRIGATVTVVCPSGDPALGHVVGTYNTDAVPSPSANPAADIVQFDDGTVIAHDAAAKTLTISAMDAEGTLILEAKNVVIRTGEEGYYHVDHAGRATRLTHEGGTDFKSETWQDGSFVTPTADQGFTPYEVLSPEEEGAAT
jgi:phage baseplate assembly protein V